MLTLLLRKSHVDAYTRTDGSFVAAHEDNRVPVSDGKIATHRFDGPGHEASSGDAVHNPIYHADAERHGGAPPSRIEFERKGVSHVDTKSIVSPQRSLNPRKVNRIAGEFDDNEADPVHLIRMADGRHALAGGNHRTVAAIMSGRSKVKAHVIDHSELQKSLHAVSVPLLFLKAGDVKIAGQAGFSYYGNPPRWHKITEAKPAPKGAPQAAHPEAGGGHTAVEHFSSDQWAELKLPDTNVNAPSYNAALAKLKAWSDAGNVTAILGAGYGTNTYGKKLATIANALLGHYGSKHQVAAGQKTGTHAGIQAAPAPADADLEKQWEVMPQTKAHLDDLAQKGEWAYLYDQFGHGDAKPEVQAYANKLIAEGKAKADAAAAPAPEPKLADFVKDTIDAHAAAGDAEYLQNVIKNNPEHPQITGYAQKVLDGMKPAATPSLAGKPAYDHLAQAKSAGKHSSDAANEWMAANPGAWDELNEALLDLNLEDEVSPFDEHGNQFDEPEAPPAPVPQSKLDLIPWDAQLLPAENSNAKSHNAQVAKIKAMAEAGDVPGLTAFIDAKAGAKQTYAKKQHLLAQTAMSALQADAPVAPAPAMPTEPGGLAPDTKDALDTLAASNEVDLLQKIVLANGSPAIKAYAQKLLDRLNKAAAGEPDPEPLPVAPAGPRIKKVVAAHFTNTTEGHNKFWAASLSPDGLSLLTTYGKIGGTAQKTLKTFSTNGAAMQALDKLTKEKKAKGYKYHGNIDHFHEATPKPGAAPAGPKEGDTKQGVGGMLVFKNGHWVLAGPKKLGADEAHAIWQQYAPGIKNSANIKAGIAAAIAGDKAAIKAKLDELKLKKLPLTKLVLKALLAELEKDAPPEAAAPPPPETPAAMHAPVPAMDHWEQTGPQGGSNPGGRFKDPATGQEWYCKFPADEQMARSEVLAAKLYGLAGLQAQDAMLVTKGGKVGIASKWANVKKAGSPEKLAAVADAQSGFAVDAWLANWDVVGMDYDNLQVGSNGKAVRVDAGGALEYRAQGAKKPFGASVMEIITMRDAKANGQAASVFGKMTEADITASVAKVVAIEDSQIRAMVFEHGPGDPAQQKAMADVLIARKADLLARYPKAGKVPKKVLDPAKLPVNPAAIPKVHDFQNWNGPGKGLSSKSFVNDANASVEKEMANLAAAGNLVALKAFRFQEVDKDSGNVTGKLTPVAQHPSKHVQQFHQDLIQILDEVANPPEPLKVFADTDVGSLHALNAAFPPKKFGTTVGKVQSNEKLGFWVALGSVGNPAKFKPKSVSDYTAAAVSAAKAKYASASKLAKHFISSVQASGSYNDLFRDGKEQDHSGNKLQDVAKAALAHATEMPEGTSLYRWQKMSPQMLAHIMSAKDGTVFQATGPMCTSYHPTATSGFGDHRVTIRYAKGAKGVESFGSGGFSGEKEVTTLPNSRFVILSKQMVPGKSGTGQRLELEILMLPPDLGI